jgi:two-component system, NtrC family, nitrogen regulation sensor histidine kinase NtrY
LRRVSLEGRTALVALLAGAPGVVTSLALLAAHAGQAGDGLSRYESLSAGVVVTGVWLALAWLVRSRVEGTMRTLANLVEAIRIRDFSIRAASTHATGAFGEVLSEVSALAASLRHNRLDAAETSALLQMVLAEVDVALFAFDGVERLTLVNRTGERLLRVAAAEAIGERACDLGVGGWLVGEVPRVLDPVQLPGEGGGRAARWELRRASFRRHGVPEQLVVLTDVGRTLRVEERVAWQRLVRVLSHEVNNSLAPIQSIASTQARLLTKVVRAPDWEDDLRTGLNVVARRAASLARFLSSYAELARLPPPELRAVDVRGWVERVAKLETRTTVDLLGGPPCTLTADPDQLDAMLLNLVKNAAEAAAVTQGTVRIRWSLSAREVFLEIEDDGEGIVDGANLFVPFFTTKRDGAGIGLVLSRQIVEAHGGELALVNRENARGCVARVRLPRAGAA